MSMHFSMITPTTLVASIQAEAVSLPTTEGEMTVLPHHTHIMVAMVPGTLHYSVSDKEGAVEVKRYRVSGGLAEMSRRGALAVFVDHAEAIS